MKQVVEIARIEASRYRQDLKPKSGSSFEILRILNRELDLSDSLKWACEQNINFEFNSFVDVYMDRIIYTIHATMEQEQAVFFLLTYGTQHKVIR